MQAETAFDLAAAELTASFFGAPVALPVITSAAKPRSAATVPRRPVVTHMIYLLFTCETPRTENASELGEGGQRCLA
jgi:hypothetical protein